MHSQVRILSAAFFLVRYNKYIVAYYINGGFHNFEYESLNEIPKYLSIDINSGEVTLYPNNLNEISETERKIFQEVTCYFGINY